jgi:preprotein translocase subunit SecD
MKPAASIFLLLVAALLGGCASTEKPRDYVKTVARFFLENANNDGTPVTLPKSGVTLMLNSKPVIVEGDIVNVELVQVDLGKCLLFQLTPAGVRDYYRITVSQQGRRLALTIDGTVVGARRIDGPITNGVIYMFAEIDDAALPMLVENLKKTSAALQREIQRKG